MLVSSDLVRSVGLISNSTCQELGESDLAWTVKSYLRMWEARDRHHGFSDEEEEDTEEDTTEGDEGDEDDADRVKRDKGDHDDEESEDYESPEEWETWEEKLESPEPEWDPLEEIL